MTAALRRLPRKGDIRIYKIIPSADGLHGDVDSLFQAWHLPTVSKLPPNDSLCLTDQSPEPDLNPTETPWHICQEEDETHPT